MSGSISKYDTAQDNCNNDESGGNVEHKVKALNVSIWLNIVVNFLKSCGNIDNKLRYENNR